MKPKWAMRNVMSENVFNINERKKKIALVHVYKRHRIRTIRVSTLIRRPTRFNEFINNNNTQRSVPFGAFSEKIF